MMKSGFIFGCLLFTVQFVLGQSLNDQLFNAVKENDATLVNRLIEQGANVNSKDTNRATVLMWAVYKADLLIVKLLKENGADEKKKGVIYLDSLNQYYYGNLIGIAAGEGSLEKLKYLIEELHIPVDDKEYSPETKIEDGWTAIEWAQTNDYLKIVEYLTEKGSSLIDIKESELHQIRMNKGDNHPDYAKTLYDLGYLYYKRGEYDKAEKHHLHALDIRKRVLGENNSDYALSLNNLGAVYHKTGEVSKTEDHYLKALKIQKQVLGEEHVDYAITLNNLGLFYFELGQISNSEQYFLQALEIKKKHHVQDSLSYAQTLTNLGLLYSKEGEYSTAKDYCEQALEIKKITVGKEHPSYLTSLNNLGAIYHHLGDYLKAKECYLEVAKIRLPVLGENHPDYAQTLNNLAMLHEDQEDYSIAERYHLEALDVYRHALGENHAYYVSSLTQVGLFYRDIEEDSKAAPFIIESQWRTLNLLSNAFSFMSEDEMMNYAKSIHWRFKAFQSYYFDFHFSNPEIASSSFNLELNMKSAILNSGVQMHERIISTGDTSMLKLYDDWSKLRMRESERGIREVGVKMSSEPLFIRLLANASIRSEAEKLEKQLMRASKHLISAVETDLANWKDVVGTLRENEVAIEFSSFPHLTRDGLWIDSTLYVALVLKHNFQHPIMIPLCNQKQLDSLFQYDGSGERQVLAKLYNRGAIPVETESRAKYSKRLFELIWEPLDSLLNEGDHIFYAPSGLLHRISFDAIPRLDSTLVSDYYELTRLSTTSKIQDPYQEVSTTMDIALFGGIDYEWKGDTLGEEPVDGAEIFASRAIRKGLTRSGLAWHFLDGSLSEIKKIASIARSNGLLVKEFSGAEATEERLKSLSGKNSPRVLHIATHGFFYPTPMEDSDSENILSGHGNRENAHRYSDNALERSGLLFAGSNRTWNGDEIPENREDGILSANEAAHISLINTELVVLSACETGLGEIEGSEGVFGLQRAFKAAGVKYIMMSLWKVPDGPTAEFMTEFYGHYLKGATIPDSYHMAQKTMRDNYPNAPYKWAAFVLMR